MGTLVRNPAVILGLILAALKGKKFYGELPGLIAEAKLSIKQVKVWYTGDTLCEAKARSVADRGYDHVGYVLQNPTTKEFCIINGSAVRWVKFEDMWNIMHPGDNNETPKST